MWIIALGEERHGPHAELRVARQHEAKAKHSRPPNVVAHIADSKVEKLLDRRVISCTTVGKSDRKHAPIPQDGILIEGHGLDHHVGLLLSAVLDGRKSNCDPSDDLFMLCVVRVRQHLLCQVRAAPCKKQPHRQAGSLAGHGTVIVKDVLDLLKCGSILASHACNSQA